MRRLAALLAVVCAAFWFPGAAAAQLAEGRDFTRLNPPLAPDRHKIEVVEFYWFGCPHCFNLDPLIGAWARRLPEDVVFRRVPAVFPDKRWVPGARLHYALAAMNLLERLHPAVFSAIHVERKRLDKEDVLFDWVAAQSIDVEAFRGAWNSFGVMTQVRQAMELTRRAGLSGVPAVIVDGRYQAVTPERFGDLMPLLDQLVERARAERSGR